METFKEIFSEKKQQFIDFVKALARFVFVSIASLFIIAALTNIAVSYFGLDFEKTTFVAGIVWIIIVVLAAITDYHKYLLKLIRSSAKIIKDAKRENNQ